MLDRMKNLGTVIATANLSHGRRVDNNSSALFLRREFVMSGRCLEVLPRPEANGDTAGDPVQSLVFLLSFFVYQVVHELCSLSLERESCKIC